MAENLTIGIDVFGNPDTKPVDYGYLAVERDSKEKETWVYYVRTKKVTGVSWVLVSGEGREGMQGDELQGRVLESHLGDDNGYNFGMMRLRLRREFDKTVEARRRSQIDESIFREIMDNTPWDMREMSLSSRLDGLFE